MTAMTATFTKLKSGSWGVRVLGAAPEVGQQVAVTKRDGTTQHVTIERVLVTGDGTSICAIKQEQRSGSGSGSRGGGGRKQRGTRTGCSCGSVEEFTKSSDCWTCKHDAE